MERQHARNTKLILFQCIYHRRLQLRGDEHLEQELKDNREQFNIVHLQSNKLFYTCRERERERERERVTLPRKLNQWRH